MRWRTTAVLAATLAVTMLLAGPAAAQSQPEVIASDLNGPQGVMVDETGMLWITEVGLGGDEALTIFDTEANEVVDAALGMTSRVLRIDPATGEMMEVAMLPSVRTPMGGFGGGRLHRHDGELYASIGEWATPDTARPDLVSAIASIGADGVVTEVANTWAHETGENPYPNGGPHSHPYGMTTGPDGRLLYADAGGNALMAVDTTTGAIETVAVFEALPGVFPRPDYDGEMLTDPVPTAVVVHNGRILVSLLSGAPFVPGSAKVVEVAADGSVSDFATGLTMLTDLRTAPDGNLYATTFAVFGEQGPAPASGSVTRIRPDGSHQTVQDGLNFVTSIDFDSAGNAYVATNGVGPPGSGQIVRFANLATGQLPATGSGGLTLTLTIAAVTALMAGVLLVRFGRSHLGLR